MKVLFWAVAAFLAALSSRAAAPPQDHAGQAFRLEGGEYRWVPFTVKQVPTEVYCRFEVLKGDPTVHMELLPMSEFRMFSRGRSHERLAIVPRANGGTFRQLIEERGQYAVVVENEKGGPPAVVSLDVSTNMNPSGAVARELPASRRLTVIVVSFALFFAMVGWSALKLLRAMK